MEHDEINDIPGIPPIPGSIENTDTFESHIVIAEAGTRFLNYIIDIACFYILIFIISGFYFIFINPSALDEVSDEPSFAFKLGDRLLSLLMYAIYMGISESIFKGKSIGKFFTKTRAVYLDGSYISSGTAFARGFSRAVPFCAFSAFGTPCNPWHDKWTDTLVIDESKSTIPQNE